tara:strand:- start:1044 stop:1430 length:387 start_codon:yes stop_codon:yes gene_type:complete
MTQLWQLKSLENGEVLNAPQKLPENWGPIFGMSGIKDRLGDLSWLGEAYAGQGWVEVAGASVDSEQSTDEELAWETAKQLLRESDWSMLPDVPMTAGDKARWVEYRRFLREVRLHLDFPSVTWPAAPE